MALKKRQTDSILIFSALAISYFIWLIARMGNVEEEVIANVPIVLDIPPYIQVDLARKTVSIEVRYPKSLRKDVHSGAFEVVVDERDLVTLAGIQEFAEVVVALLPENVHRLSLPQSVQVGKVEPSRLSIPVKYRTAKAVVAPDFEGTPAPGFRLRDDLTTGDLDLLLTGAQPRLSQLTKSGFVRVPTRPIALDGKRDKFSTSVLVIAPDGTEVLNRNAADPGRRLEREVVVSLRVVIEEMVTSRTIPNVPVRIVTLSRNLTPVTEPTSGTVVIEGPRSRVESFDGNKLTLEPRNPPEESAGYIGKVAIEARRDATYLPAVRIISTRPEAVLLRYEEQTTSPTATPQ